MIYANKTCMDHGIAKYYFQSILHIHKQVIYLIMDLVYD